MRSTSRLRSRRPAFARTRPAPEIPPEPEAAPPIPFGRLPLSPEMLLTLQEIGYEVATPIQAGAIPPALEGRDVIGQAQTGSGKTAAFAIPVIERLTPDDAGSQALVLCPTRELAVQVDEEIARLGARRGVRTVAIYGGDSMGRQLDGLRRGADVVVATPGRLSDHLRRRSLSLSRVRFAVLDEADRMLDMGFAPDVERILRQCPQPRQTMLFSATVAEWVRRLASRHMRDPVTVTTSERPRIPAGVRQLYVEVPWSDKLEALTRVLDQPDVTMALVFVETKRTADMLHVQLSRAGYEAQVIHGDLRQRDRTRALEQFSDTHVRYLIATNVAARGLDIDDISHVINYDVPGTPDEYLHRVGRTARAGRTGVAITLITPSEILRLRDVERAAQTRIEPARLDDFPRPAPESIAVGA